MRRTSHDFKKFVPKENPRFRRKTDRCPLPAKGKKALKFEVAEEVHQTSSTLNSKQPAKRNIPKRTFYVRDQYGIIR